MKILFCLFLIHTIQAISPCHEHLIQQEMSDDYIYFGDEDWPSRKTLIENSNITCSNLKSIADIPHHNFTEEKYQRFLRIIESHISTIPPSGFAQFYIITRLYLSDIHIETIQVGAFENLTKLEELHLDNNELTELTQDIFTPLHHLKNLNLNNNKIRRIDQRAWTGLDQLIGLFLKNNRLVRFEDNNFEKLKLLKNLDLSGNPLEVVPEEHIVKLEEVGLAKVSLRRFDVNVSNSSINNLNLSSNFLTVLDFSYFDKNMQLIDLSKNEIEFLENIEGLDSVTVYLNNNDIKTIPGTIKNVSFLHLEHNKLRLLEGSIFNKSKYFQTIDVSFNAISAIKNDTFSGLIRLKELYLNNNDITTIVPSLFRDLKLLRRLDLSHNKIREFQFGTFDSLSVLKSLDISSNRLVDLHQYTLSPLWQLSHLNFDNNRISSFDVKALMEHSLNMGWISLNHNPWKCKELAKIGHAFHSRGVHVQEGDSYEVDNFFGIACINPKEVQENDKRNDSETVKFIKSEPILTNNNKILNVGIVLQILISLSLLFMVCLIFLYLRRFKLYQNSALLSQIDL